MLIKPRYPKLQPQLPQGQNCAGAWLFHEGAGNKINDMTGRGIIGTVTGGTKWVAGTTGPALNCDGAASYVNVPRFTKTVTDATFIVLMRWYSSVAYGGILFCRGVNSTGMNVNDASQLGYHWDSAQYDWVSGLSMVVGKWCVYAMSISPTKAVAYIGNSAGISSATNTVSHPITTLEALQIGADTPLSRFISADIGGAMIFSRALNDSEIRPLLNRDFFLSFRQSKRTHGLMALANVPGPTLHVVQSGMRW